MKKGRLKILIPMIVVVLVLLLGGGWIIRQNKLVAEAEQAQAEAHRQYAAQVDALEQTVLTVTEHGRQIGVYDLRQLGLWEQALSAVTEGYAAPDRMSPEAFAAMKAAEKIQWQAQANRSAPAVKLDGANMDCREVILDLEKEKRIPAEDAYAYIADGAYEIMPEVPGTQLDMTALEQALRQTVDGTAPGALTFEVAEAQCYLPPQVTAATGSFDYAALLRQDSAGVTITVELLDQTRTLDVETLVSVDENGVVQADTEALAQIAAQWAEETRAKRTPYILDSFVSGPIPLRFLRVNYELDQAGLISDLEKAVCLLENVVVKAPFFCTRDEEPFAIEGTYVEVDIYNQHMTYYVDGEVFVDTDVVTGYPQGNWTPPGLYAVENTRVDQWLIGADYCVFVDYWVGFYGVYGIHDASWRSEFGGNLYRTKGSHGCVNTPTEAMRAIHEHIQVGTPVVVFYERKPDDV